MWMQVQRSTVRSAQCYSPPCELPGLDGSPEPYAKALLASGIVQQDVDRRIFKLTEPVFVSQGPASIAALPCDDQNLTILFELEFQSIPGMV